MKTRYYVSFALPGARFGWSVVTLPNPLRNHEDLTRLHKVIEDSGIPDAIVVCYKQLPDES